MSDSWSFPPRIPRTLGPIPRTSVTQQVHRTAGHSPRTIPETRRFNVASGDKRHPRFSPSGIGLQSLLHFEFRWPTIMKCTHALGGKYARWRSGSRCTWAGSHGGTHVQNLRLPPSEMVSVSKVVNGTLMRAVFAWPSLPHTLKHDGKFVLESWLPCSSYRLVKRAVRSSDGQPARP